MIDYFRRQINAVFAEALPRAKVNGIGTPWRIEDQRETLHSYDFAYRCPTGRCCEDVMKKIDAFRAACGAFVDLVDLEGIVVLRVYPKELPRLLRHDHPAFGGVELGDREVLLGFDRSMEPVVHSFKIPHLLVAGQSGYGKSELLKWIMHGMIMRNTPDELEICIIDLKGGVSFMPFERLPHVAPVISTLPEAMALLAESYEEMNERLRVVRKSGDRSRIKHFKWRVVVIDEASQMAPGLTIDNASRKLAQAAAKFASSISAVGREPGIGLIYSTQYPVAEVIHGLIKANFEAVVCFKTENEIHSRVALGASGAEKIREQGRAIYKHRKGMTLMQTPFVGSEDEDWSKLLSSHMHMYPKRGEVVREYNAEDCASGYAAGSENGDGLNHLLAGSDTEQRTGSAPIRWSQFPEPEGIGGPERLAATETD